jgi:Family of unknown function (DUF6232)
MSFSNQSLQSQLHQLLPQGSSELESRTVKTSLIKIVDNTLVFGNTVYQVRNISSVTLADLTETYAVNSKVPTWYWFLVALGVVLLFVAFIGIFVLGYVGWLFWKHSQLDKSKTVEQYGLKLMMNSGEYMIFTSRSKDFVLSIILSIYKILNSEEPKALTFNFETLQIEDKSINIEKSYGSSVVSGQVTGDVVNNLSI